MFTARVVALSPGLHAGRMPCPVLMACAENDTDEFRCQTRAFAGALQEAGRLQKLIDCPCLNRYELMTKFADPGHALVRAVSDDLAKTQGRIEEMGGQFFFDLGNDAEKESFGRKFKDPDGVILDIAQKGWQGTNA